MDNEKECEKKWSEKAGDSFNTLFRFYLFEHIILNRDDELCHEFNEETAKALYSPKKEIKELYIFNYWGWRKGKGELSDEIEISIKDIDKKMKQWCGENKDVEERRKKTLAELKRRYKKERWPTIFPLSRFKELFNKTECEYCGITKEGIYKLISARKIYRKHISRGWNLEIDRKDSNQEYTPDNSVRCCYWCNNAKTDEFTHEEFLEIGAMINKQWEKRFNDI